MRSLRRILVPALRAVTAGARLRSWRSFDCLRCSRSFAFQKLDIYIAARELVRLVHAAKIRDAEFRDQGTRAAKSVFLNIGEGLPSRSSGVRRKFFETAQCSLFETVTAVDGADAIGAVDAAQVEPIMATAHRVDAMLRGLLG